MTAKKDNLYSIPARYRKLENLHIVFWLFKDISWCMIWQTLGIIMVIPTLSVAIYIAYRTRNIKAELAHNLAVAFWISANSYWMISEFFGFDGVKVFGEVRRQTSCNDPLCYWCDHPRLVLSYSAAKRNEE